MGSRLWLWGSMWWGVAFCLLLLFLGPNEVLAKKEWKEHKARHFLIFYKDAPIDFVKTIEDSAEQYYDEITDNLGFTRHKSWSYDRRAKIYIYNNKQDYVNGARQMGWSHGVAYDKIKLIVTYPSAHGFFDSILPHELGHIIFREFIGPYARVPRWFNEGVAMYQEKAKRWGAHKTVKEAIDNKSFIPLSDLSKVHLGPMTSQDIVGLFYAESASVINYLINEQGKTRFTRFCRKLKSGKTFQQALSAVYVRFDHIDDLNRAWKNYLKKY